MMIYKAKVLVICISYGIGEIQCFALIYSRFYAIIHPGGDEMKKLLILFFVLLLVLSVCGCDTSTTETYMDSVPSASASSTNETSRITVEEALEIASQHWGIKNGDQDEATGFTFLITPAESSNNNIVIALKWQVEKHYYSTVDSIEIDPYTGRILNTD